MSRTNHHSRPAEPSRRRLATLGAGIGVGIAVGMAPLAVSPAATADVIDAALDIAGNGSGDGFGGTADVIGAVDTWEGDLNQVADAVAGFAADPLGALGISSDLLAGFVQTWSASPLGQLLDPFINAIGAMLFGHAVIPETGSGGFLFGDGTLHPAAATLFGAEPTAPTPEALYSVTSQWDGGFVGGYTITNPGSAPLTDWKIEFDLPPNTTITSVWNAELTQSGNHYVLTPASWNNVIAPDGSINIGFQATDGGHYSPPINVVVNGHPVGGDPNDPGGDTGGGTDTGHTGGNTDTGHTGGTGNTGNAGGDTHTGGPDTGHPDSGVTAAYAITSQWDSGFNGSYTITNPGAAPLTNWKLEFDLPPNATITSLWNAEVTHSGSHYVVTPASWTQTIQPGGSTTIGFQIADSGVHSAPTNVLINGSPVGDGSTPGGNDGGAGDTGGSHDNGTGNGTGNTGDPGNTGDGGAGATSRFSPYIDVTLWPAFNTAGAADAGIKNATLAFIVADSHGHPAWGGYDAYALYGGSQLSYVDNQIAALRSAGIEPTISFGGANGTYLSGVPGQTVSQLLDDYSTVVNTYGVHKLDFDIEGGAQQNIAALTIQAQALALLQQQQTDAGHPVAVSYTLPVMPTGLTADGLRIIQIAKDNGVDIDQVNLMAMDYYDPSVTDMGVAAIHAAQSTHDQLMALYPELSSDQVWSMISVTPMIGVNDNPSEIFSLSDAQELTDFARQYQIGQLSMWSAARDTSGTLGVASPTGSGIPQDAWAFSRIFGQYRDSDAIDV